MRIILLSRSLRRVYNVLSTQKRNLSSHVRTTTISANLFSSIVDSKTSPAYRTFKKPFSTNHAEASPEIDSATYDRVCSETLEALTEYFEQIVEESEHLVSADVSYGDGVLTVNFGSPHGTYVINRQTPNKQIWLSSPTSGPKRFDFLPGRDPEKGSWIYKHTGEALHDLLQNEIRIIVKKDVHFFQLPFSKS